MTSALSRSALTALCLSSALATALPASAQVAGGTTTAQVSISESTSLALGWSVKKTLMGKTIYNDAGEKIGKVDDLIISPQRNLSFVIVGAGGFIGIGRHDVAIPVSQIEDRSGRLVMAAATKDSLKAMPPFTYATDTTRRDQFLAEADRDIASGKAKVAELEKKGLAAGADAKSRIDEQRASVQKDMKAAEARLAEMKQTSAARWKDFEAGVAAATARLRKSIESAVG
jgi:PRC-barrel domain